MRKELNIYQKVQPKDTTSNTITTYDPVFEALVKTETPLKRSAYPQQTLYLPCQLVQINIHQVNRHRNIKKRDTQTKRKIPRKKKLSYDADQSISSVSNNSSCKEKRKIDERILRKVFMEKKELKLQKKELKLKVGELKEVLTVVNGLNNKARDGIANLLTTQPDDDKPNEDKLNSPSQKLTV